MNRRGCLPEDDQGLVYKVSRRLNVPVVLVANSGIHVPPRSNLVSLVVAGKEIDEGDHHILENCAVGDLVVTAFEAMPEGGILTLSATP